MPKNVRGITVEIGGDTTKLGKALKDTEQQTKNVQKELKLVNTALKFNPSNLELITQKQRLLTQEIDLTSDKLDKLKAAEASVVASFEAGEIGEEQMISFRRELIETESKLKTYTSQLEETGRQASALGQLTTAMSEQEKEVARLKEEYKKRSPYLRRKLRAGQKAGRRHHAALRRTQGQPGKDGRTRQGRGQFGRFTRTNGSVGQNSIRGLYGP